MSVLAFLVLFSSGFALSFGLSSLVPLCPAGARSLVLSVSRVFVSLCLSVGPPAGVGWLVVPWLRLVGLVSRLVLGSALLHRLGLFGLWLWLRLMGSLAGRLPPLRPSVPAGNGLGLTGQGGAANA